MGRMWEDGKEFDLCVSDKNIRGDVAVFLDRQGSQVMFGDPVQAAFPTLTPEDSIPADRHASIISVRATPLHSYCHSSLFPASTGSQLYKSKSCFHTCHSSDDVRLLCLKRFFFLIFVQRGFFFEDLFLSYF